jgi:hypothetical protein
MSSKKAVFTTGLVLFAASLACTNPITSYFSTQTAVMQTATATMWTPTPTYTPTLTSTPTSTPTPTVDPRYYFETAGRVNFAYIPPDGWKKMSVDGIDLRAWSGPGNTALIFSDMKWTDSAEDAAIDSAAQFEALLENYELIDKGVLDLESGVDNYWFSFTAYLQGTSLYFYIYSFVDGDNTAVAAMYFRAPGANEDQDSVVLESMNSFRFDK